jgi:hypothetical protein
MKTFFVSFFVYLLIVVFMTSFYNKQETKATSTFIEIETTTRGSYFKLVNDTKEKIRIHTGTGVVTLNNGGGSTSIRCDSNAKIHTAPNGTKKDFIFQVDESMCDKTIKLSAYL